MAQVQCDREAINKLKNILSSHQIDINHVSDDEIANNKGIIFRNKYYWLDCNWKLNVELLARALDITWSSDCRYWTYKKEKFHCDTIEVAELLKVCWLNVQGCHDPWILSPCTEYEVLFDIKLNSCAYGWSEPVNFSLITPDGSEKKIQLKLDQYIGAGYVKVPVGIFNNSGPFSGKHNVDITMYEHGGHWKSGLVVRGVIIRALN